MAEQNSRRIVLLGKIGSGKSSLANTLFGEEDVFQVNHLPNSGTKLCVTKTKTIYDRNIKLIDFPGFFDADQQSTELSPEILKCFAECSPGPHAFLLVLKMEKYTELEQTVVALTVKYFGEEALKYTTVVFTHGDNLPEGMKIEEWVEQNKELSNLVQKCGGRCHVFDNKYWNNSQDQYRNNQNQIEQLLQTIEQTVRENGGGYYTIEMLHTLNKSVENISDNDRNDKPRKENRKKSSFLKLTLASVVGVFLGAIGGAGTAWSQGANLVTTVLAGVGGAAGGAGLGFSALKAYDRGSSATEAVQDMTTLTKEAENMLEQLEKTAEVVKDVVDVFGDSDKNKPDSVVVETST